MPIRKTIFANGEYYHIFNRGVARQLTFFSILDYRRFIDFMSYYRFSPTPFKFSRLMNININKRNSILSRLEQSNEIGVIIVCFALMPNHFHLLIQQIKDGGISHFMKQISDGYTKYINTKYDRVGPLFQGAFKSVYVETNDQILHLSRYIHINPAVSLSTKFKDLERYPWSSIQTYTNQNNQKYITPNIILDQFSSSHSYLEFLKDQIDYGQKLEKIKHLLFD